MPEKYCIILQYFWCCALLIPVGLKLYGVWTLAPKSRKRVKLLSDTKCTANINLQLGLSVHYTHKGIIRTWNPELNYEKKKQ